MYHSLQSAHMSLTWSSLSCLTTDYNVIDTVQLQSSSSGHSATICMDSLSGLQASKADLLVLLLLLSQQTNNEQLRLNNRTG